MTHFASPGVPLDAPDNRQTTDRLRGGGAELCTVTSAKSYTVRLWPIIVTAAAIV